VEVRADLHLRPYYGDEDNTDALYHSEAKRGTTLFHVHAILCACEEQTPHAGGSPSSGRRTASSVLAEFLGVLDGLDFDVKPVYLDRGFYDSKYLTLLQAHNYAYVVPIIRWG